MAKAKQTEVTISIPDAISKKATRELERRGSSLENFIRLRLRQLTAGTKFYGLGDRYTFGKYRGELIEDVIRADYRYVKWCLDEVDGFGLEPPAFEVLQDVGLDLEWT